MTTKPLLLLAALTVCCCITSLQAFSRPGCRCLETISRPIPRRVIKEIKMIPVSGRCRVTEIIVTRKNNSKVCVNPTATWIIDQIRDIQRNNVTTSSTGFF